VGEQVEDETLEPPASGDMAGKAVAVPASVLEEADSNAVGEDKEGVAAAQPAVAKGEDTVAVPEPAPMGEAAGAVLQAPPHVELQGEHLEPASGIESVDFGEPAALKPLQTSDGTAAAEEEVAQEALQSEQPLKEAEGDSEKGAAFALWKPLRHLLSCRLAHDLPSL
jgi:hypothetical protein